jgi:hypothetical protein
MSTDTGSLLYAYSLVSFISNMKYWVSVGEKVPNCQTQRQRVTLRLAVYGHSVRLDDKPTETNNQRFFFQLNSCGYSPYVTSSLTRCWVCRLQVMLALASTVIFGSESSGTHDHIFLSQIRDSPILGGHVPLFTSPRNRVAQLYSQALGSLFVVSYDSRGYGGGIRTRLHRGIPDCHWPENYI